MKELTCRDIGVDCDVKFQAETEKEIMEQAAAHAAGEHNLPAIPQNIYDKCVAAIKDIPADGAAAAADASSDSSEAQTDSDESKAA